jgi:hypothetical protein
MNALQSTRGGVRYSIDDFLDDQQRLLATLGEPPSSVKMTIEEIEGRLRVVDVKRMTCALAQGCASEVFVEKYGAGGDATHKCRCLQVVGFLGRWHDKIVESGLAASSIDPLAVREEFLNYLLNYDVAPVDAPLPDGALIGFLDQWGHRWM